MSKFNKFIQILEASAKKHGTSTPLTIGHLLNIAKLTEKTEQEEEQEHDNFMKSTLMQIHTDQCCDR